MTRIAGLVRIDAPTDDVWAAIADLGAIDKFHPGVSTSCYTSELREGVGASRHCDLLPFGSVEERVVAWKSGESLTLEIFDGQRTPPFKTAHATMSVERDGDGTIARLALEYRLRYGVFGALLDRLLVRARFEKMVPALLRGLKHFLEAKRPQSTEGADQISLSAKGEPIMSDQEISADYPFESRFVDVGGSRLHYIEDGAGDPVLFLHGNPTWSYLWRNIVPHVSPTSRAIAVDLIGMGKSEKPDIEYRFFDHAKYVDGFIDRLGLSDITLVLHDWGSALGLYYASRHEDKVKALALMEPIFAPIPRWSDFPQEFVQTFKAFRSPDIGWDLIVNQNVFVEQILPGAIVRKLSDEEMRNYREPFERSASRKPVWRWPNEIPIEGEPADVAEALGEVERWLRGSKLPKLLFHAAPGAIMPPERVRWCRDNFANLKTVDLGRGIHFVQEDHPHRIGEELAGWIAGL